MTDDSTLAASALRGAQRVVVFTGAGISAESGLPTFRSGFNAMWKQADIQRYANPRGYRAHAPESWRWYQMRHRMAGEAQPNAGHNAIVEIERRIPQFTLVTQNVDGLHHRAGSKNLLELHGNLREVRCFDCGRHAPWPPESADPVCARCTGLLRPNVVFFEEELPGDALEHARAATASCDVIISVGTSNLVWPAAELPAFALASGASVIIVNPDMAGQLEPGERCVHVAGAAGAVLPRLVEAAWPDA
jgi:NAD-dependent deacetylase